MKPQRYQIIDEKIRDRYRKVRESTGGQEIPRVRLSWAGWTFGAEPLRAGLARLRGAGIEAVEMYGAHYGRDLGLNAAETERQLREYDIACAGVACMMPPEWSLAAERPEHRQAAIDYVRREIDFAARLKAGYVSLRPAQGGEGEGARGRAAESLRALGEDFIQADVACAVCPSDPARPGFSPTLAETQAFLLEVDHPGVRHLSADTFHMQSSERHVAQAVISGGAALVNLCLSDTHRGVLGEGFLDTDSLIMGLYIMGFHHARRFVTFAPAGADPFAMRGRRPDAAHLDRIVRECARYFREREGYVLEGT